MRFFFSNDEDGLLRRFALSISSLRIPEPVLHLLGGLPALFAIVVSVFTVVSIRNGSGSLNIYDRYVAAAQNSLENQDYQAASVFYERLLLLSPQSRENAYGLAMAVQGLGEQQRYSHLMANLAPSDNAVYAPAHVLRAKRVLSSGDLSMDQQREVELQLKLALRADPRHGEANMLLGQIYYTRQMFEQADSYFSTATEEDYGDALLLLAKVRAMRSKPEDAKSIGKRAEFYFKNRLETDPDNHAIRRQLADVTMFLERFPEAVEIIRDGMLVSEQPEYQQALSRIYISWAEFVRVQDPSQTGRQLKLLEAAMNANPDEPLLFYRMMDLLLNGDESSENAEGFLRESLAKGQAPRIIHLLLGTAAGERGEQKQALFHLNRALELDPGMYIVANNLAWHLASHDPPELERALRLISPVAERFPNVAQVRDTHGTVLAKMGQFDEAVVELEAAVTLMPENRSTHEILAEVYERLGNSVQAEQHRQLILGLD